MFIGRKLPKEDLADLSDNISMSTLEEGALLEIYSVEVKTTKKEEKYGLARFAMTMKDGKRRTGKLSMPLRFVEREEFAAPCICYYNGLKKWGKNAVIDAYAVPVVIERGEDVHEKVRRVADGLRGLSKEALEDAMVVITLTAIPPDSVCVYHSVTTQKSFGNDAERQTVVRFETEVGGRRRGGRVLMPKHVESELSDAGVFVYRGLKTSREGRKYHDIVIFNDDHLETVVEKK